MYTKAVKQITLIPPKRSVDYCTTFELAELHGLGLMERNNADWRLTLTPLFNDTSDYSMVFADRVDLSFTGEGHYLTKVAGLGQKYRTTVKYETDPKSKAAIKYTISIYLLRKTRSAIYENPILEAVVDIANHRIEFRATEALHTGYKKWRASKSKGPRSGSDLVEPHTKLANSSALEFILSVSGCIESSTLEAEEPHSAGSLRAITTIQIPQAMTTFQRPFWECMQICPESHCISSAQTGWGIFINHEVVLCALTTTVYRYLLKKKADNTKLNTFFETMPLFTVLFMDEAHGQDGIKPNHPIHYAKVSQPAGDTGCFYANFL